MLQFYLVWADRIQYTFIFFPFLLIKVSSWRRADDRKDDRAEERDTPRRVPPAALSRDRDRDRDREREGEKEKTSWRAEKDRESLRRTKNETDEDGWTTVRR